MAIQWIDTDAVSTGDGSELSPYNASQSASVDWYSRDIIYIKGSTDMRVQTDASTTTAGFFLINWPGTTKRQTRVIFEATGANTFRFLDFYALGVHVAFENNSSASNAPQRSGSSCFIYDCKLSLITGTGTSRFSQTGNEINVVDRCEVDMSNVEVWGGSGISTLVMSNSEVHSYTSITDPVFMVFSNETAFKNNKFYNIDTPEGVIQPDVNDEFPLIENNTFWITDPNTPAVNFKQMTADPAPCHFYSNVVAYQTEQPFDAELTRGVIGFRGGNLFYNAQINNYTPRAGLTDQTDTGSHPFASIVSTDSNFLELRSTSNGKSNRTRKRCH